MKRDHNYYNEELKEKRGDAWVKGIILFFLSIMFVFYVKEMFDQVLMDGKTKVTIEKQGDTSRYLMDSGMIEITGVKDRDNRAIITQTGYNHITAEYKITFSEPTDWEYSRITLYNGEGKELFSKQYNGYEEKVLKEEQVHLNDLYDLLIALSLGKGTRLRGEMIYFALVCSLIILGILSFKVWKWIFLKHKIGWAVDRGPRPSPEYKQIMIVFRFILFLGIIYFILKSYGLSTKEIFQGNPFSWIEQ